MTRDEIIEMARQAGFIGNVDIAVKELQAFAKLVAAKEREACAFDAEWCIQNFIEQHIPERIRARGNT